MKEQLQSALRSTSAVASLVPTYMSAPSNPYCALLGAPEHIQPELIGTRAEAGDLIFPIDVVLHMGEGEHVVLYPTNVFYEEIFEKIRMRSFGGFRQIDMRAHDWSTLREEHRGVEIRFDEQIPASILESAMQIEGVFPKREETFDKIWITTSATGEEVRTFFTNSADQVIYEVTRADLTTKDVEQFVGFGQQYEPKYT